MIWSPQQDQALVKCKRWLDSHNQQLFRIFGYAGTGKSELAKHLAEGVDGPVYFCAYTGKAAHVLHKKGCPNATTIHQLIYHPKEKSKQHLKELEQALMELPLAAPDYHKKRQDLLMAIEIEKKNCTRPAFSLNTESIIKEAGLIVVDECSMVDTSVGSDLLSFNVPVLVLGDPAQLPPVKGEGFFTNIDKPDVMLEEIHRQAADNPIIRMATKVRNKEQLDLGDYGDSKVITEEQVQREEVMQADQILVGKNVTRHSYNARVRALLGYNPDQPIPGDRIICLRNDHDEGLLNGALWYIDSIGSLGPDTSVLSITPEEDEDATPLEVVAHMHHFQGRELDWYDRKNAQEFAYGYAVTVHKAQGSQWNNVYMFDESSCFRDDRWKWLYTGLTRAAERITVVR